MNPSEAPQRSVRCLASDASGERMARALHAIPTAVVILDESGRIVVANERASALLDCRARECEGQRVEDILPTLDRALERCGGLNGEVRGETAIRDSRGGKRIIGYAISEVVPDNRLTDDWHYSVVFQDISDVAKLRTERDRLLKLATVGEVMPTILHELRNPIAAITTTVEVALEDMEPGPQQELLYAVLMEARRIDVSLQGLGAADRSLRSEKYAAIDHAIREAARIVEGRAVEAGVRFTVDVPSMPLLRFDPAAVRAVVFNLMNNATQFCRRGDSINVGARIVRLPGGATFEFHIDDSGCGMDEATLEKCTELFFSTRRSGSGIGLALCKKVTEEAGGRFHIESSEGEGTRVEISLPITGNED